MKYVNLVIDNKSDSTDSFYTYGCEDDSVSVGSKVYVPFARGNRLREAYVMSLTEDVGQDMLKKLKFVEKVDENVALTEEIIRTCIWMKNRYLCRYIDAINCFTPVGGKAKRGERKNPFGEKQGEVAEIDDLTGQQKDALEKINAALRVKSHERFLIYGVTGSGKTEIYMRAAYEALSAERTAIVLVPEISLTGQIIDRFIGKFGNEKIAVLHSRLSAGERYDQWQKIKRGEVRIVIGARSAVFAPLENIGLIVIDEEHESTYKSDHTPKYDTVEVALKRARDDAHKGVLLLGSATPSVVTYNRGEEGLFKILKLTERYNKVQMPKVSIVDMREELKKGNKTIVSNALYQGIKHQLEAGKQVMLFLNRRGYSTFVSCRECGYVAKCPHCGVALTYHKKAGKAMCHYCGYDEPIRRVCPECGSKYIRFFGTGTEKVEETIDSLFEGYKSERLDLDTVKKKGELEKKLKDFKTGKTRILIGTQIIAKGLDFKDVGLVGIVSADISLNIPDFRSPERTFQLITQAAGRAGRGDEMGNVVIQTYNPEHYSVEYAAAQDYEGFYHMENQLRKYMGYPPYSDLFQIVFMAKDEEEARAGANSWYGRIMDKMSSEDRENVFKPQEAYMSRIKETYRFSMLIKCPKGKRNTYSGIIAAIKDEDRKNRSKNYTAVTDINPYSFV
ncbi:MAG: primosomal protein N' [Clostridiales bacterium]|nr:primosomal protein N' [Clostridiales bacterium]